MPGLWRGRFNTGKYLVLRRDGTVPPWSWFVIGSEDPAGAVALRAYADEAKRLGYDRNYVTDIRKLAKEFGGTTGDPVAGPHRVDHPLVAALMAGDYESLTDALDQPPLSHYGGKED